MGEVEGRGVVGICEGSRVESVTAARRAEGGASDRHTAPSRRRSLHALGWRRGARVSVLAGVRKERTGEGREYSVVGRCAAATDGALLTNADSIACRRRPCRADSEVAFSSFAYKL